MEQKALNNQLLALTKHFLQESSSSRASRLLNMDADLEKTIGLGSLEKAELFHRIEQQFDVCLPESLLASSCNLQDIKNTIVALSHTRAVNYKQVEKLNVVQPVDLTHAKTLLDILVTYNSCDPSRPYIYLQQDDEEHILTYGELYKRSIQVANGLASKKVIYGDTIAIMLPTSLDFFFAFYGVLMAGAIPVPIYPPFRLDQIEEYAYKEAAILHNAGVKVLISFSQAKSLNRLLKPFVPTLTLVTDVDSLSMDGEWIMPEIEANDIAMLQYTSGSTGNPKGVTLRHANLIANIIAYGQGIQVQPDDVVVSWLPLYHDMGLIGAVMGCLYYGIPLILSSPLTFLSRPEKWLWSIHYRRATISAAPNFAYELCAKKIEDKLLEGLDLSSWRLALNGAEAIHPRTLTLFYEKFKKYGFKKQSLFPVYGLAECSVALTFPPVGREPWVDRIDKEAFEQGQKALPAVAGSKHCYEFVSCGLALQQHQVRIVDNNDNELPARVIGNLQFRGPSSMQGYYRNTASTQAAYHDGWWDTGDLAYKVNEEIFITGRKKDLIIKAGRNYYPQEIEDIAGQIDGVRNGCVAAFAVEDRDRATEKLVIVAERRRNIQVDEHLLVQAIQDAVKNHIGIAPDDVMIVPPKSIPKTSSGKLRRSSCKAMYLNSTLSGRSKAVWYQVMQLASVGLLKKTGKITQQGGRSLYTIYVGLIFLLTFTPTRSAMYFAPQKNASKIAKNFCRLLLKMMGCPLKIVNKDILKANTPCIFVANHTSYMDVIVLMAALPSNVLIVGKKEVLQFPILGALVKKLGHLVVDRQDITRSKGDLEKVVSAIKAGHSVLFFPEGTFTHVTGVRPFKTGPFKLAVDNGYMVCPIALKNVRSLLRANSPFLSPRRITVTVLPPIKPTNTTWNEVITMRDIARKEISKYCGESPIDLIRAGVET